MLRRNVRYHQAQKFQIFCVLFQFPLPRNIVHIGKVNFDFLTNREIICVLIIVIKILTVRQLRQVENTIAGLVVIDGGNCVFNQFFDAVNGEAKGID